MIRRDFITLLGGSAAAWPLAARAQQPERVRRVGVLVQFAEAEPLAQRFLAALTQGLRDLGWAEGRNIRIDPRWDARTADQARIGAIELIGLQPDVIVAHAAGSLVALRQETRIIPIVFTVVSEPVANGFVQSLAHPGGNATGFSNLEATVAAKWVEILKEIAPRVTRIAIMFNPQVTPTATLFARSAEAAAPMFAVRPVVALVHETAEIEATIKKLGQEPGGALMLAPDAFMFRYHKLIIEVATRYLLPTMYFNRDFAAAGGLLAYGVDPVHQFRQAATYVDRILRGAKAGDLPVQQPTKFELVINLKTAKALGLEVPPTLLARADEVIE
jgi:putative tryptophan/tyrosine transport system substrate-binding protein